MRYKMIVSDMDDTLLTKDKKISQKNLDYIKLAREKGCIFAIATGRLYSSASIYTKDIGSDVSIAALNGAYTVYEDEEVLMDVRLDYSQIYKIRDIAKKYNQFYYFYDSHNVYADIGDKRDRNYNKFFPRSKDPVKLIHYENLSDLEKNEIPIYKSFYITTNLKELDNIEREIEDIGDIIVTSSSRNNIEINRYGATKGLAVEKLGKKYGISRDEIIAIGDNRNDLSMLEYAGLGIAVENAADGIKNFSDYVTVSNEESAIAEVIKEFVL